VVKAVILMAGELGMDVVAEGVETEEQVATLVEAGCRLMQGYLFGRPVPVSRQGPQTDGRSVTHLTETMGQQANKTDAPDHVPTRPATFHRIA